MQQLYGSINWVRPLLGISSEDLAPLFNLLRGDGALKSPRSMTPEAQAAVAGVQEALSAHQAHRYELNLPFLLAILGNSPHLYGLLFQWDSELKDLLLILEWVFLHAQPQKTVTTPEEAIAAVIRKRRAHLCSLSGCDFACIHVPLATTEELEFLLQRNDNLQFSFDTYSGKISLSWP